MLQVIHDQAWRIFVWRDNGKISTAYKHIADGAPVTAERRADCALAFDYIAADGSIVGTKYILPCGDMPEWMQDEKNWAVPPDAATNWADGPTMFAANPDPGSLQQWPTPTMWTMIR